MSPRAAAKPAAEPWPPPRGNAALLGQEAGEGALLAAVGSGRLAHAWLITGPCGIGKATLAFRFARFLLARPRTSGAVAEHLSVPAESAVFRRVASGGHADLLTVERGFDDRRERLRKEIVVDDVRAVGAFLAQTPAEGGWRIVIVDKADALNRNAANALLKVLEEPPEQALLLLISDAPGRLLPTIRSRCRRLALQPLPAGVVAELLGRYRPDLDEAERGALAALTEGSIGTALAMAEAGAAQVQAQLQTLFLSLPALDALALHRLLDQALKQGDDGFAVLSELVRWWLGRLVRTAADADDGPTAGGRAADAAALAKVAAAAPLDRWLEVWDKTTRLLAVTDSANLDRKQVLLSIFLDIEATVRR
ncbi:MAG: DNA polymerase III subunit delta' [Rhodospirillales bacterium]|nr:DNA polymerase III subunit delta' [Rhodospirillales bacterium]